MLKVVEHKLETTRHKVSAEWKRYHRTKTKLLSRKTLSHTEKQQVLTSERDITRSKIHNIWVGYREKKYAITHKSPYEGFSLKKKLTGVKRNVEGKEIFFKFKHSYQKIYKARQGYDKNDLDVLIPKILKEKNVTGVLVVFEIQIEDTTTLVSNYLTQDQLDINEELGETVMEYITKKFRAGDTKEHELKFIYMRVIYAKS